MTATHIAVLLDQSGSMEPIKPDTIGGYNQLLGEQRSAALPGDTWTLTLFNTQTDVRHAALPIADVPELSSESYRPSNNTALLDAITDTVQAMEKCIGTDDRVLFVIITDGQENASRHATKDEVTALIARLTATGAWTFTYMGANVDAFAEAGRMGINAGNTLSYAGTRQGTQGAWSALAASSTSYRASVSRRSTSFFGGKDKS